MSNNYSKKERMILLEIILKESKRKLTQKPSSEKNLRDWFSRKGPKGGTGGWVDCNTCRKGKCKPCGRAEDEERSEYPACRPTPGACKKYKKTKGKSWGKGGKKKKSSAIREFFLKASKENSFDAINKFSMPKHEDDMMNVSTKNLEHDGFDIDRDFYPDIESNIINREKEQGNVFYGRNINWIGTRGEMIRVPTNRMYSIEYNEFSSQKLSSLENKINNSEEEIYLYAPVASPSKVSIEDVSASLDDDFSEYNQLTTGDDDLDDYIKDPDLWIEENLNLWNIPMSLMEDYSLESFMAINEEMQDLMSDEERDEYDEERLSDILKIKPSIDIVLNMEKTKQKAEEEEWGDIGEIIYQIRDGNHRAFAAKNTGEEYIWAFAYNVDYPEERNQISKDFQIKIY